MATDPKTGETFFWNVPCADPMHHGNYNMPMHEREIGVCVDCHIESLRRQRDLWRSRAEALGWPTWRQMKAYHAKAASDSSKTKE